MQLEQERCSPTGRDMQLGQERCSPTGRDDLFRGIGASKEEYPLEAGHGIDRQIAKVVHAMRIGVSKGTHAEEMQLGQEKCSPTGRDELFMGIGASKEGILCM